MGRTPGAKNKVCLAAGSPRSPRADSSSAPLRRRLRLPELVSLSLTPYPLSLSTEMILAMNAEASTIQVRWAAGEGRGVSWGDSVWVDWLGSVG